MLVSILVAYYSVYFFEDINIYPVIDLYHLLITENHTK